MIEQCARPPIRPGLEHRSSSLFCLPRSLFAGAQMAKCCAAIEKEQVHWQSPLLIQRDLPDSLYSLALGSIMVMTAHHHAGRRRSQVNFGEQDVRVIQEEQVHSSSTPHNFRLACTYVVDGRGGGGWTTRLFFEFWLIHKFGSVVEWVVPRLLAWTWQQLRTWFGWTLLPAMAIIRVDRGHWDDWTAAAAAVAWPAISVKLRVRVSSSKTNKPVSIERWLNDASIHPSMRANWSVITTTIRVKHGQIGWLETVHTREQDRLSLT